MDILRRISGELADKAARGAGLLGDRDDVNSFAGQFLIAMPGLEETPFERAVIYLCAHSDEGAMGLVVNHVSEGIKLSNLLMQLDVVDDASSLAPRFADADVRQGGPVETGRGFVLHTPDFEADGATLKIGETISLTATLDVLKSIAEGEGPEQSLLALGYAGWSAGQLEDEIASNSWLTLHGDADLVFGEAETAYDRALSGLGVTAMHLMTEAGHA